MVKEFCDMLAVSTEYRRVTDRQTMSSCRSIVRAMHTRRAVKIRYVCMRVCMLLIGD